jgi:hypothetical protein
LGDYPGFAVTTLATVGTVSVINAGLRYRERSKIIDSILELNAVAEISGETVEILESKDKKRTLLWSGSLVNEDSEPASFTDRALIVNDIATMFNCDAISVIEEALPQNIREKAEFTNLKEIIKTNTGIGVANVKTVHYAQYQADSFLRDVHQNSNELSSEQASTVAAIVQLLRAVNSQHPAIKVFDQFKQAPADVQIAMVRKSARSALSRKLTDTDVYYDREQGRRVKLHKHGLLMGHGDKTKILWVDEKGQTDTPSTLGEHLELSEKQILELINTGHIPAEMHTRVQSACELALVTALDPQEHEQTPRPAYEPYDNPGTVYASMAANRLTRRQNRAMGSPEQFGKSSGYAIKKGIGILAVAVMFGAAGYIEQQLIYPSAYIASRHRVLDELEHEKSAYGQGPLPYTEQVARISADSPYVGTRISLEESEDTFEDTLVKALQPIAAKAPFLNTLVEGHYFYEAPKNFNYPIDIYDPSQNEVGAQNEGAFGDTDPGLTATKVWSVESLNGASSAGYWEQQYHTGFDDYGNWDSVDTSPNISSPSKLPIQATDDHKTPVIKVQSPQRVTIDIIDRTPDVYPKYSTIPLLQGYKIVAANINGQAIQVSSANGLRNVIEPFPGEHVSTLDGILTYWVSPITDTEKRAVPTNGEGGYLDPEVQKHIDTLWQKARGSQPKGNKPWEQDATFIRDNFLYNLQPLSELSDTLSQELTEKNDFETSAKEYYTKYILLHKRAQCNVANSLLNWKYPEALTYTTGFRNGISSSKSNLNILSSTEAHAWNTTKTGEIVDATPIKSDTDYSKVFDESGITKAQKNNDSRPNIPLQPLMLSGLVLLAAAASRKKVGEKVAATRINNLAAADISSAYDVARTILFSRDNQPPVNPRADLDVSLKHIKKNIPLEAVKLIKNNGDRTTARIVKLAHSQEQ